MRVKERIRNQAGFSLAETLMAVLILLLVSYIVATGIPAARNAYERVVIASNADVMLSTAVSTLRDELGTAWKVQNTKGKDGVTYFSADTGNRSKLYVDNNGRIMLMEYSEKSAVEELLGFTKTDESEVANRELVYQSEGDKVLQLTCSTIALDDKRENVVVTGLCVKNAEDKTLAQWGEGSNAALKISIFSAEDDDTTQTEGTSAGGSSGGE